LVKPYFPSDFPDKPTFGAYANYLTAAAKQDGADDLGNALLSLEAGLPSEVMAAWKNAPSDGNDPIFMDMSKNLQRQLRTRKRKGNLLLPSSAFIVHHFAFSFIHSKT
jgi:hypothetical protein